MHSLPTEPWALAHRLVCRRPTPGLCSTLRVFAQGRNRLGMQPSEAFPQLSPGCHDEMPRTGRLKPRNLVSHRFGANVPGQDVAGWLPLRPPPWPAAALSPLPTAVPFLTQETVVSLVFLGGHQSSWVRAILRASLPLNHVFKDHLQIQSHRGLGSSTRWGHNSAIESSRLLSSVRVVVLKAA